MGVPLGVGLTEATHIAWSLTDLVERGATVELKEKILELRQRLADSRDEFLSLREDNLDLQAQQAERPIPAQGQSITPPEAPIDEGRRWAMKLEHESNLEMFRSTIQAGQQTLRSVILINGGAAVALLAFTGHSLVNKIPGIELPEIAWSLSGFVTGVLAGGLATGFTYLTQYLGSRDWEKLAFACNVVAIAVGAAGFAAFAWASYRAYCLLASFSA